MIVNGFNQPQFPPSQQVPSFPSGGMLSHAPETVTSSSLKRSTQSRKLSLSQEVKEERRRSSGKRVRIESSDDEDCRENESSEEEQPVPEKRPKGSPRQPGRIFVNDEGQPLMVYLQMGMHGRSDILEVVKVRLPLHSTV